MMTHELHASAMYIVYVNQYDAICLILLYMNFGDFIFDLVVPVYEFVVNWVLYLFFGCEYTPAP